MLESVQPLRGQCATGTRVPACFPFEAFVAPDELHMNDWGYACVAKLLAVAITEAATRPTASAAMRTGR